MIVAGSAGFSFFHSFLEPLLLGLQCGAAFLLYLIQPHGVAQRIGWIDHDDLLEAGVCLLPQVLLLLCLDDDELRFAGGGDTRDLVGGEGVVERDRHGSQMQGGKIADEMLRTIARHQRHAVAALHAHLLEA